jgi:hypothetical protein
MHFTHFQLGYIAVAAAVYLILYGLLRWRQSWT